MCGKDTTDKKQKKTIALDIGVIVKISGIKSVKELNGTEGMVITTPSTVGRCGVRCSMDGKSRSLKTTNLAVVRLAGHPTWAHLHPSQRLALTQYHIRGDKCSGGWEYWPLTAESPAMINLPLGCSFLTAHPRMRFKAVVRPLPVHRMAYRQATGSEILGKMFPPHQFALVLREDQNFNADAGKTQLHPFSRSI